jgi:TrmH family RNA methyltransferase
MTAAKAGPGRQSYHSAPGATTGTPVLRYPSRVTITSRQNPLVARFRDAARGEAGAAMLLDGAHLVGDAVSAGVALQIAAVTPSALESGELQTLVSALGQQGVEVTLVSAQVMDAISPVRSPSAIVALAERPETARAQLYRRASPVVVVAVDVQDPGNVGAIVRVAEAAGATGVVAAGASANPFGWKALRGSMGSALRLPVVAGVDAQDAVGEARRHGCRIVATVPRDGRRLFDADLTGPLALLVGGEGRGLPPDIVALADERMTIPMQAPVESLNAAVTVAVLLYEAGRQQAAAAGKRH